MSAGENVGAWLHAINVLQNLRSHARAISAIDSRAARSIRTWSESYARVIRHRTRLPFPHRSQLPAPR